MQSPAPAVAVLPYGMQFGFTPGRLPLDKMIWPLGQPDRLKGRHLADLAPSDHLVTYPKDTIHVRLGFGTKAKVSIMVVEPEAIHGRHLRALKRSHKRFFRAFSHVQDFVDAIPNGAFLPFGTTWVPEYESLKIEKTRHMSLIASAKRSQDGHKLRHDLVDWARAEGHDLTPMGGGYEPFKNKADGLVDFRFSVVIENDRADNFFTEKLIDALLCETVPIYWGCPNIAEFIDPSCMIVCETEEELRAAIAGVSDQDYIARLPALKAAKARAADWADLEGRVARAVLAES